MQLCQRPAQIAGGLVTHQWIKTETKEAGMGPAVGNGIPGNQSDSPYVTKVAIRDHKGESDKPGATCEDIEWVDENKVNELLEIDKPLGTWTPVNQCQSFAAGVLGLADTREPDYNLAP